MPFADSEGCRIYYRLEGASSRPLLVLVHSLGADHGMWDPQMPALLSRFQVLRLDLRGHGASDVPAGDYTIAQLARDVLAAVDAAVLGTGRDRFAYCGLSLGGMIGQWLGANAGDRIERLVLANTSPRMADPSLFDARRATVLEQGMRAIEDSVMQRFFSARTLASGNPVAESVRSVLLATNPVGYAGCCAAIRDMDHRALLDRIQTPTLVIGGDHDVSTPWVGHGEILAASIPARARCNWQRRISRTWNDPRPSPPRSLIFCCPRCPRTPLRQVSQSGARCSAMRTWTGRSPSATDFTRDFQEMITRYAWGTVWTRPGLDPRVRRLLVLAMTASLGRWEEFRLHVRTGLASELEMADLKEVLLQVAVYAGVPAANTAFQAAADEQAKQGT